MFRSTYLLKTDNTVVKYCSCISKLRKNIDDDQQQLNKIFEDKNRNNKLSLKKNVEYSNVKKCY